LSLGHALYIGVGAYIAAGLYSHFEIGPWLGAWLAMAVALGLGSAIGLLAFRFSIGGVYFALLTIAFAEFTRIGFDHLDWFGGPGGLFLKVAQRDHVDLLNFRGPPALYYYAILALALSTLALCTRLLHSRAGFYWQAIREDERAAQALGVHIVRWKLAAIALSAALTGLAGVFIAFYNNSLFPEQIFQSSRSIEIMLAPIIGGIGTLVGPLIGALVLSLLGEGSTSLLGLFGVELPGLKHVLYGLLLFGTIWLLPHGIWPALLRRLDSRHRART
jgi:branched-chain amino acid transport system permease protein